MEPANILLVDDEIPFLKTLTRRLARRNLKIITAFSGQEALAQLEKDSKIEVVVLDIRMPGIDGLQTLVEIKKAYPLVEVIILTGHSTMDDAIKGMRLGAFDYLGKPCDIDRLISRLEEAVEKKRKCEDRLSEFR
jgi:DNA-binding NtrC family response regulator